ncbi:hypothetical protein DENIT_11786 [Pseudomonas veronii]|nr:hypothetical protein DENIT_11786 [Pseudomonas veronii]
MSESPQVDSHRLNHFKPLLQSIHLCNTYLPCNTYIGKPFAAVLHMNNCLKSFTYDLV